MPLTISDPSSSNYNVDNKSYHGTEAQARQELKNLQGYLFGCFGSKTGRLKLVQENGSYQLKRRSWCEFFKGTMNATETQAATDYINALIDKSYPSGGTSTEAAKESFQEYLRTKSNSIGTQSLAGYLKEFDSALINDQSTKIRDLFPLKDTSSTDKTDTNSTDKTSTFPTEVERIREPDDFLKNKMTRNSCIGAGAFGQVYDVTVKGRNGLFVLKVENPEKSQPLTRLGPKWWRQADMAAARLKDMPHMVKSEFFILRVKNGDAPEEFFYVPAEKAQEFGKELITINRNIQVTLHSQLIAKAPGKELRVLMANPKDFAPSTNRFKSIAIGVGDFLKTNFQHNFVHRDLKPENLVCDLEEEPATPDPDKVKVIDLGLSTRLASRGKPDFRKGDSNPLTSKKVAGTPSYMSPRVIRSQAYGSEVDFFSYGMMLLKMIDPSDFSQFTEIRNKLRSEHRIEIFTPGDNILERYLKVIHGDRSNTYKTLLTGNHKKLVELIDLSFKVSEGGPDLNKNFEAWKKVFDAYSAEQMPVQDAGPVGE